MRSGSACGPQVSRYVGLSASDRKYPSSTGRSGTQRARHLRSRRTADSAAPWSLPSPSELRARPAVVHYADTGPPRPATASVSLSLGSGVSSQVVMPTAVLSQHAATLATCYGRN